MSDSEPKPKRSDFVPPSAQDLDAVLDAYEFIEILGKGGMGAVYKARQLSLDRLVAIKILPRVADGDKFRFADRFQREARAMARLSHPNIVAVYDFGQTRDDQLYIVMEYVDGTDLQKLIRTGQLTTDHLFGWMAQICGALQYAHNQGIVHRDIKPANIMINREGVVKIADFGLAKLTRSEDAQNTRLTMTNVLMGTPEYLAPEALEGDGELDHRADLYAVGVMLYEMLTGKIPRGAWSPPSEVKPGIDPRFDELVDRAMNADPDSRFQNASEISEQLTGIWNDSRGGKLQLQAAGSAGVKKSGDHPKSSPGSFAARPRKSSPGLIFGGIAAAIVVLGGIAAFFLLGGRGDKNVVDDAPAPAAVVASSVPVTQPKAMASTPPAGSFENSVAKDAALIEGRAAGEEMENGIKMKLCWIPAGKFEMGEEDGKVNVELTGGLWLAKYEVTQEEWEDVMENNPAYHKSAGKRAPVETVSWEEAMEFCKKLTDRERKSQKLPEGWEYTLPTEGQWEYACRAGTGGDYNAEGAGIDELGWYKDNSGGKTHEAGLKKANAWGLHDLHGNVLEWCADWHGVALPGGKDPKGPPSGSDRVRRGGSFNDAAALGRSAHRDRRAPEFRSPYLGFRVAAVPVPFSPVTSSVPLTQPKAMASTPPGGRFENTLGMIFIPVPGTEVLFCEHETRVKDYAAYAAANPGVDTKWKDVEKEGQKQTGDHPVVYVSWEEARAFCAWMSQKEGRTYRLPTDHEWSIAAGIGKEEDPNALPNEKEAWSGYPWGQEWPPPAGYGNFSGSESSNRPKFITGYKDQHPFTAPVKSYQSINGLFDLSGNVWEWCEDFYSNKQTNRVLRGGSWIDAADFIFRSSDRHGVQPSSRNDHCGFRCVVSTANVTAPQAPLSGDDKTLAAPDPRRRLVESVLSKRGFVNIMSGSKIVKILRDDELPAGSFSVDHIDQVTGDFNDADAALLAAVPELKSMRLHRCSLTTLPIHQLPNLDDLELVDTRVTFSSLGGIAGHRKLKEVHLDGAMIGREIVRILPQCLNLEYIGFAKIALQDGDLEPLAQLKRLKEVSIATNLSDASLAPLANILTLERISLHKLNPETVTLSTLQGMPVKEFKFVLCTVTGAMLENIAKMPQLRTLIIGGGKIAEDSLQPLFGMKQLESLRLEGTQISEAAVEDLKKALPNLKITR